MKYLILFLLFSQTSFAQNAFDLSEEELNPETQEVLIKKPEKHLRHESIIYDFNTDLGIKDQRTYTGTDSNRLSLGGLVSGEYEHINNILGFELNYMHRSERYNRLWYGLQYFQLKSVFGAITQNQTSAIGDNANDESQYQRPNDAKNSLMGAGLGVGYRFKLLMDFMPTEDVFESIDVFLNYLTMNETFIERKYQGYGLTTNYGIHKRSGSKFFYGGKLGYNLATVTREAIGTESKSNRSLSLGWLSVGFEMGIFF